MNRIRYFPPAIFLKNERCFITDRLNILKDIAFHHILFREQDDLFPVYQIKDDKVSFTHKLDELVSSAEIQISVHRLADLNTACECYLECKYINTD